MRLYYDNSYLYVFRSRVTGSRQDGRGTWVRLEDSAFYPEVGGQPADAGTLDGQAVLDVQEDAAGDVWHLVAAQVEGDVEGAVDPVRRLDHMQQHSAQHIASEAVRRVIGRETISFHTGAEVSTFDIAGRAAPDLEELSRAEELANRIVMEDRPITVRFVDAEELGRLGLRAAEKVRPPYRIVEVEDFDLNPCGGTHPRRTGEVGPIKLYPGEPEHEGFRIRFYAGARAVRDHARRADELRRAAVLLGVAPEEVATVVGTRLTELTLLRRSAEHYRKQLLDREADELAQTAAGGLVAQAFPGRGAQELRELAARLSSRGVRLVVLTGTVDSGGALIVGRPAGDGPHLGRFVQTLCAALGGRGGGGEAQAQAVLPLPADDLLAAALDRLSPARDD
ncbi:MAG: alanyl-tRNA editing protein [Thermaerobacter sp.]|nr:alanyl-tRNA editing protein [Thermaerobacter sp.]